MKIYHTSPFVISSIKKGELFDDCLFFSTTPYFMCATAKHIYSIDVQDDDLINAYDLDGADVISDVIDTMDTYYNVAIDDEQALEILTNSGFDLALDIACEIRGGGDKDYGHYLVMQDCDSFSQFGWAIQTLRAKCAKAMGYKGCIDEDEQGEVYIVPMFGRESDLTLESENGVLSDWTN